MTLALGAAGAAAALGGCSQGGSSGGEGQTTELSFTWWGNDVLSKQTAAVIDQFQKAHPDIKIAPQPGEWSSYWTKLSTQVAGNTAPDVINMDLAYIAEYGGRGALLDLSQQAALDTKTLDPGAVTSGTYDGKLYGISTGQNAYTLFANPTLFKAAGVSLPDDDTWTWDDYRSIAAKITKATGGKVHGTSYGVNDANLKVWCRQHGEELYASDGTVGASAATLTSWFDNAKALLDSGGGPAADAFVEDITASEEQTLFGTKKTAMAWWWSNQLGSLTSATGSPITLLKLPSQTGRSADSGMYYKPTMFWSASSRTKHPEQAAQFINYLVNTVEAGKVLLADRGIPVNSQVLRAVSSAFSKADQTSMAFLEKIRPDIKSTPPVPPQGTSTVGGVVLQRYVTDVLFGKISGAQAAEKLRAEIEGLIVH
jgi:multiple sugar transport system substrate-binding protein